MTPAEIFTKHVVPAAGNACGLCVFLSPWREIMRIAKTNELKDHNPIVYPFVVINCLSWVLYSYLLKDFYVFFGNGVGYLIGLYFTLICYRSATLVQRQMQEAVLLIGHFVLFAGATVAFIALKENGIGREIAGILTIIALCSFYFSPLSTLYKVVKQKNSVYFYGPISATCMVNGALWTVYGWVMKDPYIWAPNAVGAFTGALQLVLKAVFPSKELTAAEKDGSAFIEIQTVGTGGDGKGTPTAHNRHFSLGTGDADHKGPHDALSII
eukprot:tig00020629_g12470.t1